jgi:hypothetical protein
MKWSLSIVLAVLVTLTSCANSRELFEIDIIPAQQSVNTGETVQYKAVGHFTRSPAVEDITNQVDWSSTNTSVATIDASGLATAGVGGLTTIIASSTAGRRGAEIDAQATLSVQP